MQKTDLPFSFPPLTDFYPLSVGKEFIYKLDSTETDPFGTQLVVKSFHIKDVVNDTIRDNLGRLSYRIFRFITDTLEVQPWQYQITYYVTPTDNSIELMDDYNLRFIKLKEPLRNDYSWQGNTYIDTRSASSPFQFMDGWNYTYQNAGEPFTVEQGTITNTITVLQIDDTSPPGPFDPNNYQQRTYSLEVYAYHTGLIYKEFLHWTWQVSPPPPAYQSDSYGLKLSLISVK